MLAASEGQILIAMPPRRAHAGFRRAPGARSPPPRAAASISPPAFAYRGDERRRLGGSASSPRRHARRSSPPTTCSTTTPRRKPLADVLACIREKCTIAEAGYRLEANAERHLKRGAEMARLFAHYPQAVARTLEIADRITFSLDELRYEYPDEPVPPGKTPQALSRGADLGARRRHYPDGVPEKVQRARSPRSWR